ncbi:MAG: hypothetical protein FWF38_02215 [Spirochaetaceae bacterium]|nr:hypothetical protein [Spirochaetaceae bacterium]
MLRYLFLIIIFLFQFAAVYAEGVEFDYYSIVDWGKGEMLINVETVFPPGSGTVRMRDNSEDIFKTNFFKIFMDSIKKDKYGQLYFNSAFTVEEKMQVNPNILSNVDDIYNNIIKIFGIYTRDTTGMNMQYKLDIFKDIGSYFITHERATKSEKGILWTPSGKYTGIVIYADGSYPVHGENSVSALKPAIYPAVYDEKMRKVLSVEMVSPAYLLEWGSAGYFSDPNDPGIKDRVGDKPLYTAARKIFGRYGSDIIITAADADKIFYKGQNANLITEGRFVIISTLPSDKP